MKRMIALIALAGFALGTAYAGCGKKVTDTGELKAFDAEKKMITITIGGEDKKLKVTPQTAMTDAEGKKAEAATLIGTKVTVISEHKKVDSVAPAKEDKKDG